ncbi:hypothetical protein [Cohnella rhizosphaerae]|uniref:Uncharacterized protein n=1 Tax=Cohnella rhizosphaerae TaxID=1457232 RepID=A0A9X4QXV5_9BACL|nr:hypothetical protein [Cohnella rhizosphaerae]MDG0813942.1 hypothetical protein [Cohnella rhizosphaerae]
MSDTMTTQEIKKREIGYGLRDPFEGERTDLVEQEGEQDGCGEAEDELETANDQRVLDRLDGERIGEERFEMLETDPGAGEEPLRNPVILEGDNDAIHGNVHEDNQPDDSRQHHRLQRDLRFEPFDALPRSAARRSIDERLFVPYDEQHLLESVSSISHSFHLAALMMK